MSEDTSAPAGDDTSVVTAPADFPESFSAEEAAHALVELRKRNKPEAASAEHAAGEPDELPSKDGDADPETDPGEQTTETDPEETLPPIERPRSWAKDLDDEWNSYPRAAQERIVAREQERDAALRRSQNEAAEKAKAIDAEAQKLAEARKAYEEKIQKEFKSGLDMQAILFPDIKTQEDVDRLAYSDQPRWVQWTQHQNSLQAQNFVLQQAKERENQEKQSKRSQYEAEQNNLLKDFIPEIADPKKAGELRERAVALLNDDYGLKTETLSRWMQDDIGHEILANAGFQKLIADGLKLKDIQKAPLKAVPKAAPPVQRPGAAAPKGAENSARIQELEKRFERTGSVDDAFALRMARVRRA